MQNDGMRLPHSRNCLGCYTVTYRNRPDGLCPRCAWSAETLIEQIEIESLGHDLELLTAFEAYCDTRDRVMRGGVHDDDDDTHQAAPELADVADMEDAVIVPTASAMELAFPLQQALPTPTTVAQVLAAAPPSNARFTWIEDPALTFSRPFGFAIQPWSERRSA